MTTPTRPAPDQELPPGGTNPPDRPERPARPEHPDRPGRPGDRPHPDQDLPGERARPGHALPDPEPAPKA